MPIKIANDLPSRYVLENERIFVMTEDRAKSQDIRPLQILLLNLMPNKIETETQILRVLGNSPLQTDVEFLHMSSHNSKHTPASHLAKFYNVFSEIKAKKYDGMIITGAPVENLPFEEVDYWPELCDVLDWTKRHVYSTLHICWGAQAGLYRHYGVQKYTLPQKLSGIYRHKVLDIYHPLLRGFDDRFEAPHSRYSYNRREDIENNPELVVLSTSKMAGVYISAAKNGRQFFVSGHSEYDRNTLANEYRRDLAKDLNPKIPYNYFANGDPAQPIPLTWRGHANLLYTNWLNYFVYQQTPYDLRDID